MKPGGSSNLITEDSHILRLFLFLGLRTRSKFSWTWLLWVVLFSLVYTFKLAITYFITAILHPCCIFFMYFPGSSLKDMCTSRHDTEFLKFDQIFDNVFVPSGIILPCRIPSIMQRLWALCHWVGLTVCLQQLGSPQHLPTDVVLIWIIVRGFIQLYYYFFSDFFSWWYLLTQLHLAPSAVLHLLNKTHLTLSSPGNYGTPNWGISRYRSCYSPISA